MTILDKDLNATITAAVNARVEAAVMEALSGDEVIGQMVAAALNEPVTDRYGSPRGKKTYLTEVVRKVIQEATRGAVVALVDEAKPEIEKEVRKALRSMLPDVAATLVEGLRGARYGVNVTIFDES